MNTITSTQLKAKGIKVMDDQKTKTVIRNSKPHTVMVPSDEYEDLIEYIEDLEDSLYIKETEKDGDNDFAPFDEL